MGFWALWRQRDVAEVLRAKMSVEERRVLSRAPMRETYEKVFAEFGLPENRTNSSMLDRDPPDHTRLRRLVSQAFTPRAIAQLEPTIQKLVDGSLDAIDEAASAAPPPPPGFPAPLPGPPLME